MTWQAVSSYVGHVDPVGALYRGVSPWDGLWATWQTLWPWHAPWSSSRTSGAVSGLTERRRGRAGVLGIPEKTNRRRRQYLHRSWKAAQRRARERGRRSWPA